MLDLKIEGKRALVTGSSSGIGEAIVRMLAREGAVVVVHGRNSTRTQKVANEITKQGGKATALLGDLARQEDADRLVSRTIEKVGRWCR